MVLAAHELGGQREQMALIQHDDVVNALLAKGPNYPFRDRVRQGCSVGRSVVCDTNVGELGGTKEHLELVPQNQILERKVLAGTTAIYKDA